jgi:steroid delta-isomerase-like uncharacterized protein
MYQSIFHEWFDQVWNQGREAAVHRLLAPEGVFHNIAQDGKDTTGPEEFLPFFRAFRDAFPDIHITVHQTATEGDVVAGRFTLTATHKGHGLGVPPTDRHVSFDGMSMAKIVDGKLVEGWNVWDAYGLREQLGFTSAAPQTTTSNPKT